MYRETRRTVSCAAFSLPQGFTQIAMALRGT